MTLSYSVELTDHALVLNYKDGLKDVLPLDNLEEVNAKMREDIGKIDDKKGVNSHFVEGALTRAGVLLHALRRNAEDYMEYRAYHKVIMAIVDTRSVCARSGLISQKEHAEIENLARERFYEATTQAAPRP